MKVTAYCLGLIGWLSVPADICLPTATATTLDFDSLPTGTPISAGNPYAGLVNLEMKSWTLAYVPAPSGVGLIMIKIEVEEGIIAQGGIRASHSPMPGFYQHGYHSEARAQFLQPVTDVSFDLNIAYWGHYRFKAVNRQGDEMTSAWEMTHLGYITGNTGVPGATGGMSNVTVNLPTGYYLTELTVTTWGESNGGCSMLIDNLSFQIPVPDSGSNALLLALSCGILGIFRVGTGQRPAADV